MSCKIIKTQDAPTMGEYTPTAIDEEKHSVDFRLLQVNPYYIRWNDGRGETVNARQLKKLQSEYTCTTDF